MNVLYIPVLRIGYTGRKTVLQLLVLEFLVQSMNRVAVLDFVVAMQGVELQCLGLLQQPCRGKGKASTTSPAIRKVAKRCQFH